MTRASMCVWLVVASIASISCATVTDPGSVVSSVPEVTAGANPLQRVDLDRAVSEPGRVQPLPERVVLIAIQGLTPDVYEATAGGRLRASNATTAPHLVKLAESGVYADAVTPVVPSQRDPAHATLASGRRPDRHGIVSDYLMGDRGVSETRNGLASRLIGETLWRRASAVGLPVVALGWPTTTGAGIELLVPQIDRVLPGQDWYTALRGIAAPELVQIMQELDSARAPEGLPSPQTRDDVLVGTACALSESDSSPGLWMLSLSDYAAALVTDGFGSEKADAAMRRTDDRLGRLLGCFQRAGLLAGTTFVVVGDRSLQPIHTNLRPNAILAEIGLLTPPTRSADSHVWSWSVLVRSNGSMAFVYAKDEASAVLARKTLDRVGRRSRLFRVISATELADLNGDPQAWFGLEAQPGYGFDDAIAGALSTPAIARSIGGGLPEHPQSAVGFVAWGPGLRRGVRVPWMRQIDVAPTVAALLGFAMPESDGQELLGAFLPQVLHRPLLKPVVSRGGAQSK